ncbi:hypothetical protein LTR84_007897 [Exophiala bonariae]|uniref:Mei2-like C-terminal RNA recognition motif domain-containing protein n=1 Tax=Exophiala bonariae TaxID=1690606 RepID=A0AAV9NQ63_9EURO|nr:hypothetical protein LTR84_007897 [Exophiala bonariae]
MSRPSGVAMASSPPASDDTNSVGTPSTNITAFTPGAAPPGTAGRTSSGNERRGPRNLAPLDTARTGDDVFLSAPTPTAATRLSPTAEAFTPGQAAFNLPVERTEFVTERVTPVKNPVKPVSLLTKGIENYRQLSMKNKNFSLPAEAVNADGVATWRELVLPYADLVNAEVPDVVTPVRRFYTQAEIGGPALSPKNCLALTPEVRYRQESDMRTKISAMGMRVALRVNHRVVRDVMATVDLQEGSFTTDEHVFRSFVVAGIPHDFPTAAIAATFSPAAFPSLKYINAVQVIRDGAFTISFGDLRDAQRAYAIVSYLHHDAYAHYLSPKTLAADLGQDSVIQTDFHAQVMIKVIWGEHHVMARGVLSEIRRLLSQCGDIKAFHAAPRQRPDEVPKDNRELVVEFYSTNAVAAAVDVLTGDYGTYRIDASTYTPDVLNLFHLLDGRKPQDFAFTTPLTTLSVTGRSTVPVDPDYDRIAAALQRGAQRANRDGRRVNHNANHNVVDINRITAGVDVRTTIMLRNIPNRVDQALLKAIIDETSAGCYDFMYLRIDFANNCNVGYAFINFIDAQFIPSFVIARAGQRWNCFNSDKVAEISYATIQGKDCLVSKFRNSSVMLEHPAFRPKVRTILTVTMSSTNVFQLFFTRGHPNAGQEEKFPSPDNPSKMRRSVENAEHVGLYPSRLLQDSLEPPVSGTPVKGCAKCLVLEKRHRLLAITSFPYPAPSPKCTKCSMVEKRGWCSPPARAIKAIAKSTVYVDTNCPTDPFSGIVFSPLGKVKPIVKSNVVVDLNMIGVHLAQTSSLE